MTEDTKKVPEHVAIIMDGNGRWAKKRGLPRTAGHTAGAKNVEKVCRAAWELGIKYVTFYAFSTENWKRSEEEVGKLMQLFREYLVGYLSKIAKDNIKVSFIGNLSVLSDDLKEKIANMEESSKDNTGLHMILAINYGSRDEIVRAVNRINERAAQSGESPVRVTEQMISDNLDTAGIPDPDLMIRTSGELRLSNYLMWQLSYSEFYFTDTAWPDFDTNELKKAVDAYVNRDRRYGKA